MRSLLLRRLSSQIQQYQLVSRMSSHNHDRHLWQHVFLEMESALHIATQMEHATMTDHSQVPVNIKEVRIARLTVENLALHDRR